MQAQSKQVYLILYSMLQEAYSKVLAIWVFVPPGSAQGLADWASQQQLSSLDEGLTLTLEEAMEMTTAVPGSMIKRQHAGEVITVPAGWLHLVINQADVCKLAYDYFEPDKFHLYATSWRRIASHHTKTSQPDDYMQACKVLHEAILQRTSRCPVLPVLLNT